MGSRNAEYGLSTGSTCKVYTTRLVRGSSILLYQGNKTMWRILELKEASQLERNRTGLDILFGLRI